MNPVLRVQEFKGFWGFGGVLVDLSFVFWVFGGSGVQGFSLGV